MLKAPGAMGQFCRFLIVGASNTLLAYLLFWFGLWLFARLGLSGGWPRSVAYLGAYALSTLWAYVWHGRITFRMAPGSTARSALVRFCISQACLALLGNGLLEFGVRISGYDVRILWIVVTAIITMLNFLISKYWVFKPFNQAPCKGHA